MPTFTQPRTASILSDKTTFAFPEDDGLTAKFNQAPSSINERQLQVFEGFKNIPAATAMFETPESREFLDMYANRGIPFSYLYEYGDHEDTYDDEGVAQFKKRYDDDPGLREHIVAFVAFQIANTPRPNYGRDRVTTAHAYGTYCSYCNNMADTERASTSPIPEDFMSLVARLGNVAYRKFASADGSSLFGTAKRQPRTCECPNCSTVFYVRSGRILEEGRSFSEEE